ncbi:MAG TPA: helix-turn-helix transcriptional regulator [Polyangiaceae bacterium]
MASSFSRLAWICEQLGLAHSTVRVLLARAAVKLGVRTRAELIQKLQAHGPALASAARSTPGKPL